MSTQEVHRDNEHQQAWAIQAKLKEVSCDRSSAPIAGLPITPAKNATQKRKRFPQNMLKA